MLHKSACHFYGALLFLLAHSFFACQRQSKQGGEGEAEPASAQPGPAYVLTVDPPKPGPAAQPARAQVRVVPKGVYKINLEYPAKLQINGPASASPQAFSLTNKDATQHSEAMLEFSPQVTFSEPGQYEFRGELKFSVCTAVQCEMKTEKVAWKAEIK